MVIIKRNSVIWNLKVECLWLKLKLNVNSVTINERAIELNLACEVFFFFLHCFNPTLNEGHNNKDRQKTIQQKDFNAYFLIPLSTILP